MIHINNRSDFSIVWKMPNGGILPTFTYTLEFSTRGGLRYAVKSDDESRFIPKHDADGQIRSAIIVFDFSNRPHLPSGRLMFTMKAAIPNTMYPDDYQDITEPHPTNAELWDGATDYKDAVEVELILPYVKGDKGDAGEGVPAGGRTGQVLKKKSDGDYDTEWGDDEGITNIAPGAVGTEEIADEAVTPAKLSPTVALAIASGQNIVEVSVDLVDAFNEVKMLPAEDLAKIKACKNIFALEDSCGLIFPILAKDESLLQCSIIINEYIPYSINLFIDLSTGKYSNNEFDPETGEIYMYKDSYDYIANLSLSNVITVHEDGQLSESDINKYYYQDSISVRFDENSEQYITMHRSGNYEDGNYVFVGMAYEGGTDGNTDGGMGVFYKMWLNAANKLCCTASFVKLLSDADFDGGDDVPTIDITGWDGSGFKQNYPRGMAGTISDDDYAKLNKADIIRISEDGNIVATAYKSFFSDDCYFFSTGDFYADDYVISYLFEFHKAPVTSSLIFSYKSNIRDESKAGNFVVLDADGIPAPSDYKPESFRKASDKIQTSDIAEKAVTESNLSDGIRNKLTAADGAVRYDAAQELTVEQMEQALLNLGLKFMVITDNEIGKALSEERRAKLKQAEAVLFDTTNFHKVLLRGDDTSTHTKFVALVDSARYYEATYNKSTYILSSISASRIVDSNAVRFNVPQSITTSNQGIARKNIDAMANTPSGDPMHYMYETAGAEWIPYADISTEGLEDWQVETLDRTQAQADGGVWWHNDIFVTVEQNRINYVLTIGYYPTQLSTYNLYLTSSTATTNYKEYNRSGFSPISASDACRSTLCKTIYFPAIKVASFLRSFSNNSRLYRILGILSISTTNTSISGMLNNSPNLRDVNISGLNANLDLSTNVNLNVASVAYMITNADTASFTITLAPAVYAAAMADSDVQAALAAKPNVTLANAGATGGEN